MANSLLRSSLLYLPPSRLPLLYTISPFAPPGNGDLLPSKPYRRKEVIDGARGFRSPRRSGGFKVNAAPAKKEAPKWWEKNVGENVVDIDSAEEFLTVLSEAGEKLVIVEFYGTWCASCRAMFPKLCRTAKENPDILFVKVNFDENKPMCRKLNVKVLPYFHFYRGADGLLESFSCSLAKFQKIKSAIAVHNTARCSIGPPAGVGDLDLSGDLGSPAGAGDLDLNGDLGSPAGVGDLDLSGDLGSLAQKDQHAKTGTR